MLSKIRSLSQNAVVLILFGMLIFVFVFFFGLPSQGFQQGTESLPNQWGAEVNGEQLPLSEAFFYAQRRGGRNDNALRLVKSRLDEMVDEALLSQRAESMGWQVDQKSAARFALGPENAERLFFNPGAIELEARWSEYKERESEAQAKEPAARRLQAFLRQQAEENPTAPQSYRRWVSSWGMSSNQYIMMKQREMQNRGYLRFLSAQLMTSRHAVRERFETEGYRWRLSAIQISDALIDAPAPPAAEAVQQLINDEGEALRARYQEQIDRYSASRVRVRKFTSAWGDGVSAEQARARLTALRSAVLEGAEVTAALEANQGVNRIEIGWKRRSNSQSEGEGWFERTLAQDPATEEGFGEPIDRGSFFELTQVLERELGEEQSFETVRERLAQELITDRARKAAAEALANEQVAALQGGASLSDLAARLNEGRSAPSAENFGALLSAEQLVARAAYEEARVEVKESGEVSLEALSQGLISGFERDQDAADALLKVLFKANAEAPTIPSAIPYQGGWLILTLAEQSAAEATEYAAQAPERLLKATREMQGRFFGMRWQLYQLFGANNFYSFSPREISQAIFSEISAGGFGARGKSFLEEGLRSTAEVSENPVFTAALLRPSRR